MKQSDDFDPTASYGDINPFRLIADVLPDYLEKYQEELETITLRQIELNTLIRKCTNILAANTNES